MVNDTIPRIFSKGILTVTIEISVAVNNSTGNKTGYLKALEISGDDTDALIRIHTSNDNDPIFTIFNNAFLLNSISDCAEISIPYSSYSEHVGNILWDMFKIEVVDAIKLLNWLMGGEWGFWEFNEGAPIFSSKWECREAFEKADFTGPWEKVKTHKEWNEALRLWIEQKPTPAAGGWKSNE